MKLQQNLLFVNNLRSIDSLNYRKSRCSTTHTLTAAQTHDATIQSHMIGAVEVREEGGAVVGVMYWQRSFVAHVSVLSTLKRQKMCVVRGFCVCCGFRVCCALGFVCIVVLQVLCVLCAVILAVVLAVGAGFGCCVCVPRVCAAGVCCGRWLWVLALGAVGGCCGWVQWVL